MGALLSVSSGKMFNMGIWRLMQSSGGLGSEGQSLPMVSAARTRKGSSQENAWKLLAKRFICCLQMPVCLPIVTSSE